MHKAMKAALYFVEGHWKANKTRCLPDELAFVESQLQLSNIQAYKERRELAREQLRLKCQVEATRKQIMLGLAGQCSGRYSGGHARRKSRSSGLLAPVCPSTGEDNKPGFLHRRSTGKAELGERNNNQIYEPNL